MYEKLPKVKGSISCGTCGCGARSDLPLQKLIAVGFGTAGYSKDGVTLWQEQPEDEGENCFTVEYVEKLAQKEPEADWRIFFYAPLYEAEYQRQGENVWALVKKGEGFA